MGKKHQYIDYYEKNKIAPVDQNIADWGHYYSIRSGLYRQLGIPAALSSDKRIIEFGPGVGAIAVFFMHFKPERYVLVDANSSCVELTRQKIQGHAHYDSEKHAVEEAFFEDFNTSEKFDIVLCEGCIPSQQHPDQLLQKFAGFVAPGGVLATTCMSSGSWLSEYLRRIIAFLITDYNDSADKRAEDLLPVFSPHLDTMQAMTRPHKDWILDNILQPMLGEIHFSIPDAIRALSDGFEPIGSSPSFFTDWRWYKELDQKSSLKTQEMFIEQYARNEHNFLDYRFTVEPRGAEKNAPIAQLCRDIFVDSILRYSADREEIVKDSHQILGKLRLLHSELQPILPETAKALADYNNALEHLLNKNELLPMHDFKYWFGRGQQYLAFRRI